MVLTFEIQATKIVIDIGNENLFVFLVMSLVILHLLVLKQIRKRTIKFANYEVLKKAIGIELLRSNILVLILRVLIVISLVLALYKFQIEIIRPVADVDFVIAIDVSQTMMNSDDGAFLPSKLEVAKETAKEIIRILPERTKVGIVSFSGNARIEIPLTQNKNALINSLDKLTTRPPAGTAMGDAIVAGIVVLSNSTKTKKGIVLITDGRPTKGLGIDINESIRSAKENNITINTIGLGKKNITTISLKDINITSLNLPESIKEEILKEVNKTYNITSLDEKSLIYIANETGGNYYYVANQTYIKEAFADAVLKFNAVTIDARKYALLFGVILLLIEYLLGATRFKTIP